MQLEQLTSPMLNGLTHGFFTRRGGVSSGIFAGLNCGLGSSDQEGVVRLNRGLVAHAMGVPADHLTGVHQVHSATVVRRDTGNVGAREKADALVTDRPGIALSVLAADCAPVLLADQEAGVIGAVHSGWRGAWRGVLAATVEAMDALGARRIRAAVGPCISQRSYEVGPEFLAQFCGEDPSWTRFFAPGQGDRMLFDLPGFVLARLRDAGADAEWLGHCTYLDEGRFFSYRRTTHRGEADYGRLISAIRL
ncbi:MAG: peptidoglycan editing factor PgeF [Pseudomonadota bacterium]